VEGLEVGARHRSAETVISWQRNRFKRYWRRLSQRKGPGRPAVSTEIRKLVRTMAAGNPLWGAPRIHGELLKLGFEVSERTVSRSMPKKDSKPSQTWMTFVRNHVGQLVSIDFFTVPTIQLRVLYVFIILAHDRRRVLHFKVTEHPTAIWAAQQIVEAFPDNSAPRSADSPHFRWTLLAISNLISELCITPVKYGLLRLRTGTPVEESGDDYADNEGRIVCGIKEKMEDRTKTSGAIRCDRKVADVGHNSHQYRDCVQHDHGLVLLSM
jgi:hypothetical protein